jgi:predicted  nucleic acid-binding Zn-ribbon protein
MPHECDDCGESFETLTRLRLHDCAEVSIDDGSSMDSSAFVSTSSSASSSDASIDELDDLLRRVSDGDSDAVHGAVATYESA